MRPAGDIRLALLKAAAELATAQQAPTLRELATVACVGYEAAFNTVHNMVRAGDLVIVRRRKVDYRNRPVAEYAPPPPAASTATTAVERVLSSWMR